jgi:hypothetical protein
MGGSSQIPPPTSRVLRNLELAPGQEMFIGFPMKMWPCAPLGGWQGIPTFTVMTRYLFFTYRRFAMVLIRRQRAHAPARRQARPERRHLRAWDHAGEPTAGIAAEPGLSQ